MLVRSEHYKDHGRFGCGWVVGVLLVCVGVCVVWHVENLRE